MLSIIAALLIFQTQPASPPDPEEAARLEQEEQAAASRAEAARRQAEGLANEVALMQQQLVDLGERVGASENAALDAERELARLTREEADLLARLTADRETLIDILAAIQRIESQTPPAVLAAPDDAAEAARAAALMAEVAPALRERADQIANQLTRLRDVRASIEAEQTTLNTAERTLSSQRLELEVLIAERQALEARRRNEAVAYLEASSTAGQRARSIRSLIGELSRMAEVMPTLNPRRQPPETGIPGPRPRPPRDLVSARVPNAPLETLRFADARGRLRPPASGEIVREFGEVAEDGTASEGIFIRTRPRAQVVSPFDGRVEFAGPFNTYGGLLILNVGDGYYVVLAGMSVTYASVGQSVLAGEPVGAMSENAQPAPDLYLELRRNDDAIDPGPWFRT
ncbi:peptidoglycan DD-metalloendopeptidase family protein [Maricaulis sp.]|jgi:murein hydrolase activator|uniref:murein hydrolase activator EnvC family protein n=1 Tax=Maricaulis sp. TaxID=1486257 RepID=UPI0025D6717B|nr:peptidoglycan DD-metalloendopeptidase family protein [Maricaulis sp.]MDF1767879.1 peptidoglycan DD-metalloendopeptidase family protein [Maricaulis sp.]